MNFVSEMNKVKCVSSLSEYRKCFGFKFWLNVNQACNNNSNNNNINNNDNGNNNNNFFMNGNTERAQCALSRVCIP